MKKITIIALFSILLFTSCKQETKVEFKKVADIDMGNLKKPIANLLAVFVFENLAEEEFDVRNLKVHLKIDGKDIGTIFNKEAKNVRGHSEFSIPVKYEYKTEPVIGNNEDPENVYLIEMEGVLTLRDKAGKEFEVPLKHKSSYTYKTKKEERKEKREQRKAEKALQKAEKEKLKSKS
ncbi:MAG TPA: hypothetical protein PLC61_00140 [Chitinophagales bacterium]|nr:hypothetical protein [Chitinophagales bacterium]MCB9074932.1 hypothetical protein [Chitinophagales bacterium]HMU98274.1 hypothetical protein [Chitinophagales bacterium]HMV01730.1 hypothetical protein [Chitinophagales bacterium]HMY42655.1 hypothetical protein [Chitinophagales bacterium]